MTRRRPLTLGAALVAAAVACSGGNDPGAAPGAALGTPPCRRPVPAADVSVAGTFEEANLLAAGEMFRVYGAGADPTRHRVDGDVVEVDGARVWRIDGTYEVTVDGERRRDRWTLWVGPAGDRLEVLCADGPPDVAWPPATRSSVS